MSFRTITRRLAIGAIVLLPLMAGTAFGVNAPRSLPSEGRLDFSITRNGTAIGTHIYRFAQAGERTTVEIRTNIDFRLLFIPVYRFRHQSREIWDGDRLMAMESETDDNGEPVRLSVHAEGTTLKVQGKDGAQTIERSAIPASLWHASTLDGRRLLSTVSGGVMEINVEYLGEKTLEIAGESVVTRHYRMSGGYDRELWYDRRNDVLVRVRFEADDGSQVEYVRLDKTLAARY